MGNCISINRPNSLLDLNDCEDSYRILDRKAPSARVLYACELAYKVNTVEYPIQLWASELTVFGEKAFRVIEDMLCCTSGTIDVSLR